jgi:predicted  nucleic acid-binding Zn-ribbon protein
LGESTQSQVEKLENSASKSMDSSVEVLTELSKSIGSGLPALKTAAGKIDAAIARLKTDSAFQQDVARCREQLQRQRKDIEAMQGSDLGEAVQDLVRKIQGLEKRVEDASGKVSTSMRVMESTKNKIEGWQKIYSQFEGVVGKDDAVRKVKDKVDLELRDLQSKPK